MQVSCWLYRHRQSLLLSLLAVVVLQPQTAHAQEFIEKAVGLVKMFVSLLQTVASLGCIIAMIRAGMRFTNDSERHDAVEGLKSTLVGCAIIFGAVGIVQLFKSQFGEGLPN
jgi:hypothetical protein